MKKNKTKPLFYKCKTILFSVMFIFSMANLNAAVIQTQGKLIKVNENNVNLNDLVWKIKKLTGYEFVCDSDDLKKYDDISIDKEGSIDQILKEILKETDLTYYSEDDIYVIKKKDPVQEKSTQQEKKTIKGKVTDDQGIPLPGVSVVIKGTNIGVATNIDGEYSLEFEQENVVLVYSFVGMTPQEVAYSGQEVIDVTLGMDTEQMAEVVVTGYQKISKERITGSFINVKEEELDRFETATVAEKLKGQLAGVLMSTVTVDGEEQTSFSIRGTNTINGDTEPLFVVDGFPIDGDINDINPNDIESVNVLQDAAAASIWGARAANGVVVITTKKGDISKKPIIELNVNTIITPKVDLDDLRIASTPEVIGGIKELFTISPDLFIDKYGRNEAVKIMMEYQDNIPERDRLLDLLAQTDVRDEYSDLFLRTGVEQRYNLSIKGGN